MRNFWLFYVLANVCFVFKLLSKASKQVLYFTANLILNKFLPLLVLLARVYLYSICNKCNCVNCSYCLGQRLLLQ